VGPGGLRLGAGNLTGLREHWRRKEKVRIEKGENAFSFSSSLLDLTE